MSITFEHRFKTILNTTPEVMEEIIKNLPLQMLTGIFQIASKELTYRFSYLTEEMEDQIEKEIQKTLNSIENKQTV